MNTSKFSGHVLCVVKAEGSLDRFTSQQESAAGDCPQSEGMHTIA